jgi:hypothetical protein
MGVLDTIFQNTSGAPQTSTAATQQTFPDWYTALISGLGARGIQIASKPYQQYTGARVAGFSPLQQTALQQLPGQFGASQGLIDNATQALQQGGGALTQWGAGPMAQYMSPYTSGAVNEVARLGNRNFTENIMPSISGAFTGAGQFGSTRNADILGRAARDTQADISGKQANMLESGYKTAADIFGSDQNRIAGQGTNLASAYGNLAQTQQGLNLNALSAIMQGGNIQQNQQQKGLDLGFQDWQEQQGYDLTQLNNLKTAISGLQLPAGSSSIQSGAGAPGASPLQWLMAVLNQNAGTPPPQP